MTTASSFQYLVSVPFFNGCAQWSYISDVCLYKPFIIASHVYLNHDLMPIGGIFKHRT